MISGAPLVPARHHSASHQHFYAQHHGHQDEILEDFGMRHIFFLYNWYLQASFRL